MLTEVQLSSGKCDGNEISRSGLVSEPHRPIHKILVQGASAHQAIHPFESLEMVPASTEGERHLCDCRNGMWLD
jgi:hypothetical protein